MKVEQLLSYQDKNQCPQNKYILSLIQGLFFKSSYVQTPFRALGPQNEYNRPPGPPQVLTTHSVNYDFWWQVLGANKAQEALVLLRGKCLLEGFAKRRQGLVSDFSFTTRFPEDHGKEGNQQENHTQKEEGEGAWLSETMSLRHHCPLRLQP